MWLLNCGRAALCYTGRADAITEAHRGGEKTQSAAASEDVECEKSRVFTKNVR